MTDLSPKEAALREEMEKRAQQFIHNVSHDLQAPSQQDHHDQRTFERKSQGLDEKEKRVPSTHARRRQKMKAMIDGLVSEKTTELRSSHGQNRKKNNPLYRRRRR